MRWLAVLVVSLSLISCELGVRDLPSSGNAVTYNGVKYAISKSVVWPVNGVSFSIDLAQTGVVIDPESPVPDPDLSEGFALMLSFYTSGTTSGTFLVGEESPQRLETIGVATYDASGEATVLFNDFPDSGGVKITVNGSNLSVHGSLIGSYIDESEELVTVPVRVDYDGPYTSGVWP